MTGTFNLHIPQGTDYTLTLSFTSAPSFRTAGAKAGATQIPLTEPLAGTLSTGDKVSFAGAIATLTANATLGAESLTVAALPFNLGRTAGAKVLNLTGHTAVAEIWRDFGAGAIDTFTTDLATAPTDGQAIITLSQAQVDALPPTLAPGEYPTEAEVQALKYDGTQLLWNIRLTDSGGITQRPLQGVVVTSPGGA